MNPNQSFPELHAELLEEASSWFIDFNEDAVDESDRAEFNQWLRRSPEHVRAYVEIAAAWDESSRFSSRRVLDSDELVARAREDHNVIGLTSQVPVKPRPESAPEKKRTSTSRWRSLATAAVILIAIAGTGMWFAESRNVYSTDIGEQRTVQLADGSTVELNSRSRLRVRLMPSERAVDLLDGEALFEVTKDAKRPFVVYSGATSVRAVGTQFDVYRKPSGTTVTVVEGRVSVAGAAVTAEEGGTHAKPAEDVLISAGEQVTVAPRTVSPTTRANIANVTAWRERKLVFEDATLADAIAEFNRYNARAIVLDNPALKDFHIRGTFSATDPNLLVEFLRARFEVDISETSTEIRIAGK